MKKKCFIIFVTCFSLLAGTMLFGSEVGNNPEGTGWRIDWGFDHSTREVELDKKAMIYYESYTEVYDPGNWWRTWTISDWLTSFDGQETLDKLFIKVSYGWGGRYAFYFKGGTARMKSEIFDPMLYERYDDYEYYYGEETTYWDQYDWLDYPIKGKGEWGTFYGMGFKAVFFEAGDFRVGMDAQYNNYKMDSDVITYQDSYIDSTEDWLDQSRINETKTTEYHLAITFSKKNPMVSPYGGVKLSSYKTDYEGQEYYRDIVDGVIQDEYLYKWQFSTKPQDFYGFFFGVDAKMTPVFALNGEIRVGDETAMTVLLSWVF